MPDTVQMNLLVRPETKRKVAVIAQATYRGMSDVIEWLVNREWNQMTENGSVPAASVEQQPTYPVNPEG